MNSRVITHPSTVEKLSNTTVVIIDADAQDVAEVAIFCQTSYKDYDIYLYKHDLNDLMWLNTVLESADQVLVSQHSGVKIENQNHIMKFGSEQQLNTPLVYFQQFDVV